MVEEIRKIMLEHAKDYPDQAFHVTCNLNWLRYQKQISFLAGLLAQDSKVLEIGCGWGFTTALLSTIRPDIRLLGSDINEAPTWSDLRNFGCNFQIFDATNLPFDSEDFDSVISFGVMEHVNGDNEFLSEIHRCLKNGGYNIIFQLPNRLSLSEYSARICSLWHHERCYSIKEIRNLLTNNQFEIIKIQREHFLPAQVDRISHSLGKVFNKNYVIIDKLDAFLCKPPLSFVSQDYMIISRKK
jgi:SAM-dependent methyltransferase